jgi:hypothetical protein
VGTVSATGTALARAIGFSVTGEADDDDADWGGVGATTSFGGCVPGEAEPSTDVISDEQAVAEIARRTAEQSVRMRNGTAVSGGG